MKLGTVRTAKGNLFGVRWDPHTGEIYVSYAGWTYVGKATSASQAMSKAEAWLHGK